MLQVSGEIRSTDVLKDIAETLPGASIYISDANGNPLQPMKGVNANPLGQYSINVNAGDYLTATFVGRQRITKKAVSSKMDFVLPANDLPEVEITSKKPFQWRTLVYAGFVALAAFLVIYELKRKSNN